jgi:hypothetical protein
MTMSKVNYKHVQQKLQTFLESEGRAGARLVGYEKRRRQLTAERFAMLLILGYLENGRASLNELVRLGRRLGIQVSAQALSARMNAQGMMYMAYLLRASLAIFQHQQGLPAAILQGFRHIRLIDSTQMTLPPALRVYFAGNDEQTAKLKTHLCFDYLQGNLEVLEFVAGRSPDQKCELPVQMAEADTLLMFDLGYFNQHHLATIQSQSAFFITPLQPQLAICTLNHTPLDLIAHLQGCPANEETLELVCRVGGQVQLPVRLVARRLPAQRVAQRRRQAQAKARDQGYALSPTRWELLAWELLITNLPPTFQPASVFALYDLRWQIELVFKLWKSQLHLADFGNWHPHRLFCQLFARLIAAVLFQWLITPYRTAFQRPLSPPKAFQIVQAFIPELLTCLGHRWRGFASWYARLRQALCHFALLSAQRQRRSSYELIASIKPYLDAH